MIAKLPKYGARKEVNGWSVVGEHGQIHGMPFPQSEQATKTLAKVMTVFDNIAANRRPIEPPKHCGPDEGA